MQFPDNTTLVHQFSRQNFGDGGWASSCGSQEPLLEQRPRTGGSPDRAFVGVFAQGVERNPDKFGTTANNNREKCSRLVTDFFNDNVKRARERNQRYRCCAIKEQELPHFDHESNTKQAFQCRQGELERKLREPNESQARREHIWSAAGRREGQYLRFLRTKDKPDNYQTIKVIGQGAYGEVKLVQKKADGRVYAMKSLTKTEMLQKEQLAHVRAERDILAEAESPWVVKLFTTFQDAHFLYMLLEFLPGGDLMTMLIKYEIFSEDITRFYIAETILAIEAVHKLGFIHRYAIPSDITLDIPAHH